MEILQALTKNGGKHHTSLSIEEGVKVEPLRTLLFVPGNRQNMIEKARNLPADVLVLDLEDSVPSIEKANARALVRDSLAGLARGSRGEGRTKKAKGLCPHQFHSERPCSG